LAKPPEGAYLSPVQLDDWARDTNGEAFSQATKDEILESLDVTDDGNLTLVLISSSSTALLSGRVD
jgi:hypothetical protein